MWMHDILSQILFGPKQRKMTYLPTVSAKWCVHVALYVLILWLKDWGILWYCPQPTYSLQDGMWCCPFFPLFLAKLWISESLRRSPSPLGIGAETRTGKGSGIGDRNSALRPRSGPIANRRQERESQDPRPRSSVTCISMVGGQWIVAIPLAVLMNERHL